MSKADDELIFPSGRSVARVRQDAKAISKKEGVPLSKALDDLVLVHTRFWGLRWAQAIEMLRDGSMPDTFPGNVNRSPRGAELDIYSMAAEAPRQYPWDHWERIALEQGISADLASLGRAVLREHYNHGWDSFASEVSHRDSKAPMNMLLAARHLPEAAAARWRYLLVSDGGRAPHDLKYAPPVDVSAYRDA